MMLKQYLLSIELLEKCKINKQDFTRKRSLTFVNLTIFIINFVKRSLQLELYSFADFFNVQSVTKQAFSKARKKLSPMIFTLLNQKLLEEFYSDNVIKTFKKLRLLAIDGSTLRLPQDETLRDQYGTASDNSNIPMARTSILFDILNNITIHGIINDYRSSERDMAIEHIEHLLKTNNLNQSFEDLLLFDRGYPSIGLLFILNNAKKQFLMRVQKFFFAETNAVINSGLCDSIVTISRTGKTRDSKAQLDNYLPNLEHDATLQIRFLIFDLDNGQKEYIITSLVDQEQFSYTDIFTLYGMRWNIEESYKLYKNIAEIENFSGKSQVAIEQDFYATIFSCNISALLMSEAQDEIEAEIKEKSQQTIYKYKYKINRNILIGTIKNEIMDILIGDNDLNEYCEKLKARIKKNLIAICPGRQFSRKYKQIRSPVRRAL